MTGSVPDNEVNDPPLAITDRLEDSLGVEHRIDGCPEQSLR